MKIFILLAYTCALISTKNTLASLKGTIHAPLDLISLEDISPEERKQIAYLEYKLSRSKRSGSGSGSGDILGALTKAIGQGIKKKIGQIARASVSASGHFSSSSSSSGHSSGHSSYSYHHPEHVPETYDHKSFDFWSLKKSILNTLLQAVKAIKGGVIAVKGQLIKGSGKLISVKGRLISAQGDSITQLGKNIASSAVLVPFHGHPSSGHGEYHDSAPSAPEEIYHGSPSGPDHDYHVPENYPPPHHPGADGLLILKKMRGNYAEPDDVPPFKPLEPTGPSFGTIAGKLFSASSSLDPHKPELFGNTASGHIHHESNNIIPEEHGTFEHKIPVPTTSYGTPFEQPPGYLDHNFGDYTASDSKNKPSYVKADGSNKNDPAPNPDSEYVQPLVSGSESTKNSFEYATMYNTGTLNNPHGSLSPNPIQDQNLAQNNYQFSSANELVVSNSDPTALDLPNLADYPDGFPPSTSNTQSAAVQTPSVDINGELSAIYFQQSPSTDSWPQIIKPSPFLQTPILSHMPNIAHSPPRLNTLDLSHSSTKHRMKSSSYKRPIESKGLSSFRTYRPSSNSFEVVKSMSFELGPNGPKRLT
ncbi:unnamed protein product [Phaedon cochleariae]|uniref:Uncharacterized protein n=1 Tax=Phaedon cochleariae TaxID=80249 RepID=A0A9P0DGZ8_PHACE|nr:unnamed protein product [Phaedon cochleariae]